VLTSQATINNKKAFTLIELIIVMAVMTLFVTMAMPRFRDKLDLDLKRQARMLSGTIRFLYNQAAVKNKTYRLHYDLDKQTYWVESSAKHIRLSETTHSKSPWDKDEKPKSSFTEDKEFLKKPVELRKKIKFKDIKTEASSLPITSGAAYTHFFPHGYAEQTQIRLETEKGKIFTIVVQPLTGMAKVYDHDLKE